MIRKISAKISSLFKISRPFKRQELKPRFNAASKKVDDSSIITTLVAVNTLSTPRVEATCYRNDLGSSYSNYSSSDSSSSDSSSSDSSSSDSSSSDSSS